MRSFKITHFQKHVIDIVMIPFDNSSLINNIIKINTLLTQNMKHKKSSSNETRGFLRFRTDSNCTNLIFNIKTKKPSISNKRYLSKHKSHNLIYISLISCLNRVWKWKEK